MAFAAATSGRHSAHPGAGREAFDERRLQMLVTFSSSLRWPVISTAVVMAAVAWAGGASPLLVGLWLAATIAVREVRAARMLRLQTQTATPVAERLRSALWWTLALGAAYGCAALFMLQLDTAAAGILTMVLMSLSAGAVSTTFSVVRAFVAFAAGIAIPTALMWLATGGWIGWCVGALVLMFMGVQVRFARQNMALFEESYSMRLENQTLLRELSAERAQLAQARDTAVQADLSKSRFLAAASHDLRQPLQSLLLNSSALSRLPIEGECRAIAQDIGEGIEALRQMLDALLDVSQLDAGAVSPRLQKVALAELLEGVCARFRPAAAAKGLELSHECPHALAVTSDAQMLRRIVANLVDNAIKFTAAGRVTLDARVDDARAGEVLLTIADTGAGIDPADRERVFEDLVQLHNPQRDRAAGTGLGLGIVRRLARVLGIDYEIDSQPGRGTRFVLHLSGAQGAVPIVTGHAQAHPALVARRVLVLDDNAQVRDSYANALASLGCKVVAAAAVQEALDAMPAFEPEVALVDYRLAEACDGLEAIERLRAARPSLAAVLVTADTTVTLRERAAGVAVTVLRKPVTDAMLAATINDALHEIAQRDDDATRRRAAAAR
jgi:signal transduction histidine kinase/ActR/RegA family two-component response regulator